MSKKEFKRYYRRPFPANPRRYNITKRVEQIFFHKSGLSLRGAAQQTANGTTHRRRAHGQSTTSQNPSNRPFQEQTSIDRVGTGLPTCPRGRTYLQRHNLPATRPRAKHNITKPVKQAFSRTNRLRLCRDRSPDLSARQDIPSTVHPPGDVLPHERNQTTSPQGFINKDTPHRRGAHRRAPPTLYGVTSTIKQAFPAKAMQVQRHKTRQQALSKNKPTQIV